MLSAVPDSKSASQQRVGTLQPDGSSGADFCCRDACLPSIDVSRNTNIAVSVQRHDTLCGCSTKSPILGQQGGYGFVVDHTAQYELCGAL